MNEQWVSSVTPIPWPLRQLDRLFLSALAGAAVALAATALPYATRIILGLDVFLVQANAHASAKWSLSLAESPLGLPLPHAKGSQTFSVDDPRVRCARFRSA